MQIIFGRRLIGWSLTNSNIISYGYIKFKCNVQFFTRWHESNLSYNRTSVLWNVTWIWHLTLTVCHKLRFIYLCKLNWYKVFKNIIRTDSYVKDCVFKSFYGSYVLSESFGKCKFLILLLIILDFLYSHCMNKINNYYKIRTFF